MTEPTKFEIGGVWEESEWRIEYDHEVIFPEPDEEPCPHGVDIELDDPDQARWSVPRVVVATNEGGFNSTGVCLDCILDATMPRATITCVGNAEDLVAIDSDKAARAGILLYAAVARNFRREDVAGLLAMAEEACPGLGDYVAAVTAELSRLGVDL